MTINDGWLLERAHTRKAQQSQTKQNQAASAKRVPPVDALWNQLQEETKRQAKVFTRALGDPGAVTVKTPPDRIEVLVPDGRQLVLTVDRKSRKLSETFRNQGGAVRIRKPLIAFSLDAHGKPTFNFGGLPAAAASLLRRLI